MAPMYKNMSEASGMAMEDAMGEMSSQSPGFANFFGKLMGTSQAMMEHALVLNLASLILTIIALFGVIQMWKLKKLGFYLYTAAEIVLLVFPLVIVGFNLIMGFTLIFGFIITAAFIIMYALNLKALK